MRIKSRRYGRALALAIAYCAASSALSAEDQQARAKTVPAPSRPASPVAASSPPSSPVVVNVKATLDIGKEPIAVHVLPEPAAASEAEAKSHTDSSLVLATWGLVIATFLLFLVTGGLFAITVRMAADAKRLGLRQAAITKRALRHSAESNKVARAGHRPWVKFSVSAIQRKDQIGAAFTEDGNLHVNLKFTLKNVGFGPALNVFPDYAIVPTVGGGDERDKLLQAQDAIISRAETGAKNMGRFQGGITLFPGDMEELSLSVNLPAVDLASALAQDPAWQATLRSTGNCDWLQCAAVGTIQYRDGDGALHHTRFAYGLGVVEGFIEGCAVHGQMPIGPNVSAEQLLIYPKFLAGNLFLAD